MQRRSWNHNTHYHGALLRHVPLGCRRALDVGCGAGEFARRLAARAQKVDAIDADANVVERAPAQADVPPNVRFLVGDFLAFPLEEGAYDVVAALASLHHMPFDPALTRMTRALRPGGALLVLGVWPPATLADKMWSMAAAVANVVLKVVRGRDRTVGRSAVPVMSLTEVRARVNQLLPGARLQRRLLWRYTLVWTKPDGRLND